MASRGHLLRSQLAGHHVVLVMILETGTVECAGLEPYARSALEALAVHDGRTALIVLLLRDPHLLEGREGRENGTTDPDGVLPLGRGNNLDLHGRRRKSSDLLLHTVRETRVHGGTSRL